MFYNSIKETVVELKSNTLDLEKKLETLQNQMTAYTNQTQTLSQQDMDLQKQIVSHEEQIKSLSNENMDLQRQLIAQLEMQQRMQKENNDFLELEEQYISKGLFSESQLENILRSETNSDTPEELFYSALEALFRGNEDDILLQMKRYLPYLKDVKGKFLDIGCGRGEFLHLLAEEQIAGIGVDKNAFFVKKLREAGYEAVCDDGLSYLMQLEDESLAGVSAFQVIEHIEFDMVWKIVKSAYDKLSSNGVIILETVNPYCILGLGSFYLDPTHIKLHTPDTIRLILLLCGFKDTEILYYAPIDLGLRNKSKIEMNYQGYAVVGYKDGKGA